MAEIDQSLIGKWGPEGKMRVEFGKIREFARAVKEDNPLYFDEARSLAPPTFLMTMALWSGAWGGAGAAWNPVFPGWFTAGRGSGMWKPSMEADCPPSGRVPRTCFGTAG